MKQAMMAAIGAAAMAGWGAAVNMNGRQSQNEGIFAVPAPGEVKVDGELGEWDLSGQIWSFTDYDCRETYSWKTAAMWDRENLYMAFEWRDPTPLNGTVDPKADPGKGWTADAIQLRIDAGGVASWWTMWGHKGGACPAVHMVRGGGHELPCSGKAKDFEKLWHTGKAGETKLGDGVEMAYRKAADGKGFVQEVKIPWGLIVRDEDGFAPKAGAKFKMGIEAYWATPAGQGWPEHCYKDNLQPGETSREFFWTNRKVWGDATLAGGPVERRKYVPETIKPEGAIAVRFPRPKGGKTFSVAILNGRGEQVRHLAGGYEHDAFDAGGGMMEVKWDGLDETGELVPAGEYTAKIITVGHIEGYWKTTFYNPGNPPFGEHDGKGSWGSDHNPVKLVACAGDAVALASDFAESGFGTFAIGRDGKKLWSEKRGSGVMAAIGKWVFIVPDEHSQPGSQIARIDIKTGEFAPFRKGEDMPHPLRDLFKLNATARTPRVLALAASGRGLLAACDDNLLRTIDPETGAVLRTLPFVNGRVTDMTCEALNQLGSGAGRCQPLCPLAADDRYAYTTAGREVVRTDLESGETEYMPIKAEAPSALAVDGKGNLLVGDSGVDSQVKLFSAEGKLLKTYGRKGGRPRTGPMAKDGMRAISSIAKDGEGKVWVVEYQQCPRRVSVWNEDGTFDRDYTGNAQYKGSGTTIHLHDKTKAMAGMNEIAIDPETGAWEVSNVMYNPDRRKGTAMMPGGTPFDKGNMFSSSASGERREYFAATGNNRPSQFFAMVKNGDRWETVAGICLVADLQNNYAPGRFGFPVAAKPWGEWEGLDGADAVIWNDFNNDGYVTRDECEVVKGISSTDPQGGKTFSSEANRGFAALGGGAVDPEDLGFVARMVVERKGRASTWQFGRMTPVRYREGGKPVYGIKGFKAFSAVPPGGHLQFRDAACPVPGKDMFISFVPWKGLKTYLAGVEKSTGKVLWRYRSPYHSVHGSHNATMPRPGLLTGCLKVTGVAANCGGKDVCMIRGNLGEDYFVTCDGMYAGRLTRDGRLPGRIYPRDAEHMRAIPYSGLNGYDEPFTGTMTGYADGTVWATSVQPSTTGGNIVEITGLDTIRDEPRVKFAVTAADLVKAERDNAERAAKETAKKLAPLEIGKDEKSAKRFTIEKPGQKARCAFRGWTKDGMLELEWVVAGDDSPWLNKGNDWRLLFKTGDMVDFQYSAAGTKHGEAGEGDFRLTVAPFGGGNAVVLMRQKAKSAPAEESHNYSSPVMTVKFDSVKRLKAEPKVTKRAGGYTVRLSVPWAELGSAPSGTARGDAGFILSDEAGKMNVARVYRANRQTNLVSDQPGEAIVTPAAWGPVKFAE